MKGSLEAMFLFGRDGTHSLMPYTDVHMKQDWRPLQELTLKQNATSTRVQQQRYICTFHPKYGIAAPLGGGLKEFTHCPLQSERK